MTSFDKQPYEEFVFAVDFTPRLPTGATVASGTVTAIDETTGADASSTVLSGTATTTTTTVARKVVAGTSGTRYKLTYRATLSSGDKLEQDVRMVVRDA